MTHPASSRRRTLAIAMTVPAVFLANGGVSFALQAPPIGITHDGVSCVVAGRHPKLDASLNPADRVGRAQIHFRANGAGPWYAVDLAPGQPHATAILPRPLPATRSIEYFVSLVDRGFAESRRPDAAPGAPYRMRVEKTEAGCDPMGQDAAGLMQTATPTVVTVVRDSSGRVLGPGAARGLRPTLEGFSREGVILSDGPSGVGAGVGTGALLAGGAVIAAGGIAMAAAGGGDNARDDPGDAVEVAGRWSGTATMVIAGEPGSGFTQICTSELVLDARQSGRSFTGTLSSGPGACVSTTPAGTFNTGAPPYSGTSTGTVDGSAVSMSVARPESPGCPGYQYTGTVEGNALTGVFSERCQTFTRTISWTGRR